jgi:hypothetical protein
MKNTLSVLLAMVGTIVVSNNISAQGHYHLHVAATGKNQGDALYFDDQDEVGAQHGFVSTMSFASDGKYAGYYQGNLTTDVLSIAETNSAYSPDAPAAGSWIHLQLASVDGPEGGSFSFWETNAVSPTYSLTTGEIGTNAWKIGENDGSPDSDPYGHIHGRRYTATKPGIYIVGFRALDRSTNGAGGNPIHTTSGLFHLRFQAGLTISSITPQDGHAVVEFGATGGGTFALEYASPIDGTNFWQQTGDPIAGNDHLLTLTDTNEMNGMRLYRIRRD